MNEIIVSLDIEMTTPRPENQEILEIAAIKFKGSKVLETWTTLINPGCQIPYNIQVLTGIQQRDVDHAPTFSAVAGDLVKFIGRYPLVAHTVSSDVSCLERKGLRIYNTQLDTFELASVLLPHLHNYSLASLVEYFGIPFKIKHRAAADALMTKELFLALENRAAELDISIIQEINRLTASLGWPLAAIFRDIEREKVRTVFEGASIMSRLAAKSGLEDATLDMLFASRPIKETLEPVEETRPIDVANLVKQIQPGGAIAAGFGGYEYRPEQGAMMAAVASALNDEENLIVEAGTGVGKSLAYLLPAIAFSTLNQQHVVVSTNTINLQDQLFNKDMPDLQAVLPVSFRAALVKGRGNYLCQRRWAALRRHQDLNRGEILTLVKILVWLPSTETGDVAELNLTEEQRAIWQKLYAQAETCLGSQCLYFRKGSCFLYRARQKADAANIVVVNHSLLLSDLMSASRILPEYKYLIVDEAHHFEDEATDQFGFKVSDREVNGYFDDLSQVVTPERRLGILAEFRARLPAGKVPKGRLAEIDSLVREGHEQVDYARELAAVVFNMLIDLVGQKKRESRGYESRLRLTAAVRVQPGWSKLEIAWDNLAVELVKLETILSKLLAVLGQLDEAQLAECESTVAEVSALLFYSQEIRGQLNQAITNPLSEQVYWISIGANGNATTVHGAPLQVGPLLEKMLYANKNAVVLTSATLSTGGNFDFIKERLGLAEVNEVLLGSPFDYAKSALIYVPDDVPEPDRPDYQRLMQDALRSLVIATQGRALVLFTSHNNLRQTYQAIKGPLQEHGILAVAHGVDGSARQLLQTFRTNPKTVLLGTSSFWEGVDVVGEALSVLVIVRLPFAVPTDPIVAARGELFDDAFSQYSVPQSILRFKQGFGRLIRSKNDRGVVVVLDRRIISRSYGSVFRRSLPPCSFQQGPARNLSREAVNWLREPRVVSDSQPVPSAD